MWQLTYIKDGKLVERYFDTEAAAWDFVWSGIDHGTDTN